MADRKGCNTNRKKEMTMAKTKEEGQKVPRNVRTAINRLEAQREKLLAQKHALSEQIERLDAAILALDPA